MIKIYNYGEVSNDEIFARDNIATNVEGIVSDIIANVINRGDEAIFEYALKRNGATAETTVMIGDNYDADVQGAKNAGWHTILFNIKNFDRNNVPDADVVVETLEEIKSIL